MGALGVALNGYAMRYYDNEAFKLGAFTHPDPTIRREAIDLTKRGLDSLAGAGGRLMTLWMGQDGFDYSFQADYGRALGSYDRRDARGRGAQSRHRHQHRIQAQRAALVQR